MSLSSRPYLLRGLYSWLVDNGLTPHILVAAEMKGVQVPLHLVQEGQITLNIAASAVRHLELGDEWVSFSARFSGQSMQVHLPLEAIVAIFARENGAGMAFGMEPVLASAHSVTTTPPGPSSSEPLSPNRERKTSHLTRVK